MIEKWDAEAFEKRISDRERETTVVEFYTDWCPTCKTMSVLLDRAAKDFREVAFGCVNVEEEKGLLEAYHIRTVPTLMVFRRGRSVAESVGAVNQARLEELIRNTL